MLKFNICNILFYLLGIFTTIQLLSIAGLTLFNIFLICTVVITFVFCAKRIKIDIFFLFSSIITVVTILLSVSNGSLTDGFKKAALVGGITYCLVLVLYLIMNTNARYASELLRGFNISCKLTLFWCVLQIVFDNVFHLDINTVIFKGLLKIENARSDYYNGSVIPSGFYSHRAILMPSLVYLFFSTSNPFIMALIILIALRTRSTALIMGLMLALAFRFIVFAAKKAMGKKSSKKILLYALIIFVIAFMCMIIYKNKIVEIFKYILMRIMDSTSNKAGNSSVVHFLYYKNLLPILKNMDIIDILFGTGFGTSGQHYTWFNGQYANFSSWVVESDYVNILLSQGFIGMIVWICLLAKIVILSIRYKYWENISFVLVVAFIGIMYNIQFTWFIIVEFAILILTKNKIRVFNFNFERKRFKI